MQNNNELLEIMRIQILTYNLFLRPVWIKTNESDYKDERLDIFSKTQLSRFDIICFQEVFQLFNCRKDKLIRWGLKSGYLYFADCPMPSFSSNQLVDGGLVTLSRYPITAHKFYQYPFNILADYASMKGVLYTKIKVQTTFLHLFNTHTQASYTGNNQDLKNSVLTRLHQIQSMTNSIIQALETNDYQ